VVVAVDFPGVGNGLEEVGLPLAGGVLDARHFGAMDDVEPAVLLGEAEDFVEAMGEAGELRLLRIGDEGVLDHPDLSAACADGDLAVRHHLDGARFEDAILRRLEAEDLVVVLFRGLRGGRLLLALGVDGGGQEGEGESDEKELANHHEFLRESDSVLASGGVYPLRNLCDRGGFPEGINPSARQITMRIPGRCATSSP
jgi:hypothetical protein